MTKSKIFFYFCFSFIGGIFLSSITTISQIYMLGILILGLILISVFWEYKKFVVIGFCILFVVAGVWRHQIALLKIEDNELRKFNDLDQIATIVGVVRDEPDVREKSIKLIIETESFNENKIKGKVLVTVWRYPEYQYGDKLKIIGKLETPKEIEDFNYPGYLAKDGIYSISYFPKIELLERGNYRGLTPSIYAEILKFKNKLRESIYQNLSPPQSSILGAIILGDKRKISEEWKEKLNITGVRHITAISGLHVTVLTTILMTLLIGLGLWRQQAFYFTIILITLFILMTGLQPSAIRAGIMGGLFLLAQYLGKMNVSSRAIVFAGAVILVQNPLLLKLDVGFQLSFLAVMGIIYLAPIFQDWLKFIPEEKFINLRSILVMTLSAQIFTLPILIYNFGRMSLVAPITNILILPAIYWIMIFGFIFAILGVISPILGLIFSFPGWLLLTYLTKVVDFFSKIPLAYKTFENVHWIWLSISYLILGFITWRLQERFTRPNFLR